MNAESVEVVLPVGSYTVHVGMALLEAVGRLVPPPRAGRSAVVVADATTGALFGSTVRQSLHDAGWHVAQALVEPGESSKSLAVAGRLYGELADAGLDRGSAVFALGGGVVGDLAGFVAATYMRGIAFVALPTTLLAQVDSSVGGKVAVDLPQGKNLVGAFHQPVAVVADVRALGSLPPRELSAGLAEVVKHAAIADADLFVQLERLGGRIMDPQRGRPAEVVARNCRIKASVVSEDPEERTGRRAVLNYGHTVGHAIERGAEAWGLRHGEAVALGMIAESRAAVRLGLAGREVAERAEAVLGRLGLPVGLRRERVDVELARRALRGDKKVVGGRLALPVVPTIGAVTVRDDVGLDDLEMELMGLLH